MKPASHQLSAYPLMVQRLLQKYPHAPIVSVEQPLSAQDFAEQKEKQEEYPIEGVALGVVTTTSDEVILTQRTKPFRGWGLPGGRVEQGEEFDEAIVREVREECGVEVRINDLVLIEHKQFLSPEQESRTLWLAVFRAQVLKDHAPYTTEEAKQEGLEISVFTLHQLPADMVLNDRAKVEAYFHLPQSPLP